MKKSVKTIATIAMVAVMSMSAMATLAAGASAEEQSATETEFHWMAPASAYESKGIFNKAYDPAAPEVSKTVFEEVVKKQEEVGQYNIKEGKYYVIRRHATKVNSFGYTRTNYEHRLVKVERVFEDPTWYGSERTVDVRYCDTGETRRLHPGKFFEVNYPLFEIDNSIIG